MKEDIVLANELLNKWCNTSDINYYEGIEALGFLFKHAVPKLYSCEIETLGNLGEEGYEAHVNYGETLGSDGFSAKHKDPAFALFWAIYPILVYRRENVGNSS